MHGKKGSKHFTYLGVEMGRFHTGTGPDGSAPAGTIWSGFVMI